MSWSFGFRKRNAAERELDKELAFDIDMRVAEKVRAGMSAAEARREVTLEFGGVTQVRENCRESRRAWWLRTIAQDLRFGTRILARSPGFSAMAILVLALGIGVCTLAFSLYNLAALQLLPVRDAASIVRIERRSPDTITPGVPYVNIDYFQRHATTISAFLVSMGGSPSAFERDDKRVTPGFVSANYFSELGGAAAAGRLFDSNREDAVGTDPVVVLSYRFWQNRYSLDPSVVGKTVRIGGKPATVIGIALENFAALGTDQPDLWLPIKQLNYFVDGSRKLTDPKFEGNTILWGRLARGASPSQVAQELLTLTGQLRSIYPGLIFDHEWIVVTPGAHFFSLSGDGPSVLGMISGLVFLVLAIACANLGGLLSARGMSRRQEIELRLQLGARKMRLFRQLLTENLLLGVIGSLAALPLAFIALRITLNLAGAPDWMSALPDWRVFAFSALTGLMSAVLFGFLPALQLVRVRNSRRLWNKFIVCVQVGASCVLMILTGLLVRATLHTLYSDPGFAYQNVVSIEPELGSHGYTPSTAKMYLDAVSARLRTTPGVTAVSWAMNPPLVNRIVMITSIDVEGKRVLIYPNWVSADFFRTVGIPLLRGRVLRDGESHAVVISQSLALRRWPHEDPIGKRWNDKGDIVVGVVGNTRAQEMNNTDATEMYMPIDAERMPSMAILVATSGLTSAQLESVKAATEIVDPRLLPSITPLRVGYQKTIGQVEEVASIVSVLGSIAVFLAVVGLLGLVSYAVAERTREIAIRLAVGAGRLQIFAAVMRRFVWPVLIGMTAGVAIAAGLAQFLRRMLFGIGGLDPASYASALLVLALALALAALPPIRRAFALDAASILKSQ